LGESQKHDEEERVAVASRRLIYRLFTAEGMTTRQKQVAREVPLKVYVNGGELITLVCTPQDLRELALGFLHLEGIIDGVEEVAKLRVRADEGRIDVRLTRDVELPTRRLLIRGVGGGSTFTGPAMQPKPVVFSLRVTPSQILALMERLYDEAKLYLSTGGVHTSALSDGQQLLFVASDVGRHNSINKMQGYCLRRGVDTRDRILLTTGHLSTEMLNKGARMQVPVLVSRSSPTDLGIKVAKARGLTLIGYARGGQMHVYSGEERMTRDCVAQSSRS
jgi:FdhD protein